MSFQKWDLYLFAPIAFALFFGAYAWSDEPGISSGRILLGLSSAQSGPAAKLGIGVREGALAWFKKVNSSGGVKGRQIELVSLDDGYDPQRALANTVKLINEEHVFALFGFVGTPTSSAVLPTVEDAGIPYIAPFTGAMVLRNPVRRTVRNIRASYNDETEALVEYLTSKLKIDKIGIFMQDDSYGNAGISGLKRALDLRGLPLVGKGVYSRNTENVDAGLEELREAAPEAVVMIGTYSACAAFIKKALAVHFRPKFLNVSFVGTSALVQELGRDGEGVMISQVMPSYRDRSIPVIAEYQRDMRAAGNTDLDYTSLEGYIGARVLTEGIGRMERNSREALLSALDHLSLDLGGYQVHYSATDHDGSHAVYLTEIRAGRVVEIQRPAN